jgi:hypothetical protein
MGRSSLEIPLSQGKIAIIDAEDASEVLRYKWCTYKKANTFYAATNIQKEDGKQTTLLMHRLILNPPPKSQVDHRNGNGLDNRRSNLRIPDNAASQQQQNSGLRSNNTSGFKGVYWRKDCRKWRAQITLHGCKKHLGYFETKEEAAIAYDKAAQELFGQFARTKITDIE